jgi:hypothetical protein
LGGHEYYIVDKNAGGTYEIQKITFSPDMTSVTREGEGASVAVDLHGDSITIEGKVFKLAAVEPEYVLFDIASGGRYVAEMKMYTDRASAQAYITMMQSENHGHTDAQVAVTTDMISGKTFYHAGVDASKGIKIYRKFTFTTNAAGEDIVDLHLSMLKAGGMVMTKNPKLPYVLIDGKIRIDTSAFYRMPPGDGHSEYFIFTLQSEADGKWNLKKEIDRGQDGVIDGTFYPAWHTTKPSNFIE